MASAPWVSEFHSVGLTEGILVDHDADTLMQRARERTGLDDFGDPRFLAPLQSLVNAIKNTNLSLLGRMLKLQEVLRLLETRLRIEDYVSGCPDVVDQKVDKPIFIVSLPRAGSTILFELMSQKSGIRTSAFWEAVEPVPAPQDSTYDTDPRIESTDGYIESWNRVAPDFKSKHAISPTLPVECLQAMSFSFASAQFVYATNPSYYLGLRHEDWVQSYEYYKRVLQILQSETKNKQWLLKSPAHLHSLPGLFEVFPDARVVFIHRDPRTVIASTASVMSTVVGDVFGAAFNPSVYLKKYYADEVSYALDNLMKAYDDMTAKGACIVNTMYKDVVANPVQELTRIYEDIGLPLNDSDRQAVADYIDSRPKHKYGRHSYSMPPEIDVEAFAGRITPYIEKFGVPEE